MPPPDPQRLEDLLSAAGRAVQPSVPGWQMLPDRLAATPQLQPRSLGRWATLPLGAAAAAAILLIVWWSLFRSPLQAQEQPIEVQRVSVDLTILSMAKTDGPTLYMPVAAKQNSEGQALVKDRRLVLNLKPGDNIVKFTDIAASIDPTSVRFESLTDPKGTTVVEQSFEYDLASADALLKRFIDREIVCVDKTGQEITGLLASYDAATIVLTAKDKDRTTQNVSRSSLQAVRLSEMPAELIARPTLVWKLRTQQAGKHETMLSYICGFMKWQADYVIDVTPGETADLLEVNGWVTLENTSGSTYPRAGLRLIAGDVRRLRDPWARPKFGYNIQPGSDVGDLNRLEEYGIHDLGGGRNKPPAWVEQSFFEYHLYTLNTPCTVADHQIKQLSLLKKTGVKASRRYLFDPQDGQRNLAIELVVKNDEDNKLGVPLPKGRVTLQQQGDDGELAVIGQTEIDHTAVKEELKLRYGHAFDVVGEHREVGVEKIGKNQRITYETKIRNHKPTAVAVKCYGERLGHDATLREASMPHVVEDTRTYYFEFTLAANEERVIRYSVVNRSEK